MAEDYPQLDIDVQVCLPLCQAARVVTRRYTDLLSRVGLTYPQYVTMLALWGRRQTTVGDLGARLDLDSATMTPVLKRLEAAGLVARKRDPDDERRVLVEPTRRGWALRAKVAQVPWELGRSLPLDPAEWVQLRGLLTKLTGS